MDRIDKIRRHRGRRAVGANEEMDLAKARWHKGTKEGVEMEKWSFGMME